MISIVNSVASLGRWPAILTLHRVGVRDSAHIAANQDMVVSLDELDRFILSARRKGWSFISIDELAFEISKRRTTQRTITLTFDDGYLDNYSLAFPLLRAREVPFTIYVTTGFIDSECVPWWYRLESVLSKMANVTTPDGEVFDLSGIVEKNAAFLVIRKRLLSGWSRSTDYLDWLDSMFTGQMCGEGRLFMNWAEVNELSKSGLVTLGAHTHTHQVLSRLSDDESFYEMKQSKDVLERQLGGGVTHLAYPYGGPDEVSQRDVGFARDIGFTTAVTTRLGAIGNQLLGSMLELPRAFFSPDLDLAMLQKRIFVQKIKSVVRRVG